jgi:hypothetical protein
MHPKFRTLNYLLNLLIVWAILIATLPLSRPASASTYETPQDIPHIAAPTTQAALPPLNDTRQQHNGEMLSVPQNTAGKTETALTLPAQQGQVITSTWNFEGSSQGWEPVDFRGDGPSYWEANPSLGGSIGVWQTIASSNIEYRYAYIMYPHPVSLDRVTLDYYIRESGFNVGGAVFWIYTSTNKADWTLAATIPQYEPAGGGHYSRSASVNIDRKYVMVGMRINRAFTPPPYGYLDNVTFRNCSGCGPLFIEVFDSNYNLIKNLSNNNDGWPTPNPLTAIVTFSCPAGGPNCTNPFNLTIDSTSNARFLMYAKELGADQDPMLVACEDVFTGPTPYSHASYVGVCTRAAVPGSTTFTVLAGDTKTLQWQIWIQPSAVAGLDFVATWGTTVVTWTVQIPQAQIHPLVFIPGYMGTWPPEHGGNLDPIAHTFDNALVALQRAGYELGPAGSGASLIPFGWDWRFALWHTGRYVLAADIQAILDTTPSSRKPYVNYAQTDIVAHSVSVTGVKVQKTTE